MNQPLKRAFPPWKRNALVFILISLVATLLIGTALPRLKFAAALPVPSFENGQVVAAPTQSAPVVAMRLNTFVLIVVLALIAIFFIIAIYRVLRGMKWKQVLRVLLSAFITVLLVGSVLYFLAILLPRSQGESVEPPMPQQKPLVTGPLGPVPLALIWIVGIGLAVIAIALGAWIIVAKRREAARCWEHELLWARQALLDGQDMKEVILGCYLRMGAALQEEQQIEREESMTAGEFERLLAQKGVPPGPVHQLTVLFEAVRYGHWQPALDDDKRAIQCLDAILEYSHRNRKTGSAG